MHKILLKITYCLILTAKGFSALAQGTFTNLNFESAANLPIVSMGQSTTVAVSNALPGWTVFESGIQQSQMIYNGVSLGGVLVTLVGTNTGFPGSGHGPLAGNYSVTIDNGENNGNESAAIAQTGLIPSTAKSLIFIASGDIADQFGILSVSFNGQTLPVSEIIPGANFNEYGADVSAFAGTVGQLEFTENISTAAPVGVTYLDNISFSPVIIPEPSTWSLLLGGGALLGLARRRRSRA